VRGRKMNLNKNHVGGERIFRDKKKKKKKIKYWVKIVTFIVLPNALKKHCNNPIEYVKYKNFDVVVFL
jgi:hypothetical protein